MKRPPQYRFGPFSHVDRGAWQYGRGQVTVRVLDCAGCGHSIPQGAVVLRIAKPPAGLYCATCIPNHIGPHVGCRPDRYDITRAVAGCALCDEELRWAARHQEQTTACPHCDGTGRVPRALAVPGESA